MRVPASPIRSGWCPTWLHKGGFARFTPKVAFKILFKENKDEIQTRAAKLQRCEQWVVSQPPNRSSWTPFCQRSFPGQACHPKGTNAPTKKEGCTFLNHCTSKKNESEKLAKHQFSKSIFTFRLNFLPNKHWARGKKRAQGPCKDSTRFNRIFIGGWFPLAHVHS